jgi:hypothetical protein
MEWLRPGSDQLYQATKGSSKIVNFRVLKLTYQRDLQVLIPDGCRLNIAFVFINYSPVRNIWIPHGQKDILTVRVPFDIAALIKYRY